LRRQDHDVAGLLQQSGREANGRPRMDLLDIASGRRIRISQNLGRRSRACCVDADGMAQAAMALRRAIDSRPALLVINKFSRLEAAGGGLVSEFLAALAQGLPVLIGLSRRHQDAFAAATGGIGELLAAEPEALAAWATQVITGRSPVADRRAY
jgi:nucleoside-triphosphatase THEP1